MPLHGAYSRPFRFFAVFMRFLQAVEYVSVLNPKNVGSHHSCALDTGIIVAEDLELRVDFYETNPTSFRHGSAHPPQYAQRDVWQHLEFYFQLGRSLSLADASVEFELALEHGHSVRMCHRDRKL